MLVARYPTKKALKASVGMKLMYQETSMFGPEYKTNEMMTVVGPKADVRKWYASVWVDDTGKITKVK